MDTAAALRVDQRKPREVAKNQMPDNNTSCAILEISWGNWFEWKRFGPICLCAPSTVGLVHLVSPPAPLRVTSQLSRLARAVAQRHPLTTCPRTRRKQRQTHRLIVERRHARPSRSLHPPSKRAHACHLREDLRSTSRVPSTALPPGQDCSGDGWAGCPQGGGAEGTGCGHSPHGDQRRKSGGCRAQV